MNRLTVNGKGKGHVHLGTPPTSLPWVHGATRLGIPYESKWNLWFPPERGVTR